MHNGIIHVYSYGLFSHTRRRQNSPIRKWTNINIFLQTSLRFVCLHVRTFVAHIFLSQSRTGKSIEHDFMFNASLFETSFDVCFGGHPTIVVDPNIGPSPPRNWGVKGVGNEVGRVNKNFHTHNFVSFPPTHLMCLIENVARRHSLITCHHFFEHH